MKIRFKYLSTCLIFSFLASAQEQESPRPKRHFLYASLEAGYDLYTLKPEFRKYDDFSEYQVQRTPYHFKSPALGVGHLYLRDILFLRNEFLFWYASKEFRYSDFVGGTGPGAPNTIYQVQSNSDEAHGFLRMYNMDWDVAIGRIWNKNMTVYAGFRKNFLLHYSVNGYMKRDVITYQYNGWNMSPANYEEHTEEFYNNRIKDVWTQKVYGLLFIDFGFNFRFKIKQSLYFSEVEFCLPPHISNGFYDKLYIHVRLARCFGKKNKGSSGS